MNNLQEIHISLRNTWFPAKIFPETTPMIAISQEITRNLHVFHGELPFFMENLWHFDPKLPATQPSPKVPRAAVGDPWRRTRSGRPGDGAPAA